MEPNALRVSQDSSPVAALYRQYAPALFAYLHRRCASPEDAEDLLLEVFLAALEHEPFSTIPEGKRLRWLRGVAKHKLVDHYRRAARRPFIPLDEIAEVLVEDEGLAPEQITLRKEVHTQMGQAWQRLSVSHQEVLSLRFIHGLRCTDMAAVLGKQEGLFAPYSIGRSRA